MSHLSDYLLSKPVTPAISGGGSDRELTKQIEVKGDKAEVVLNVPAAEQVDQAAGHAYLMEHGLDPAEWEPTSFRTSEWTMSNGEKGISVRFAFSRKSGAVDRPKLDDLLPLVEDYQPSLNRPQGDHGFIVALGDMQFGKIDGDGVEGTLFRTLDTLNRAADLLQTYRTRFDVGHVHVAWLGDHIEGFVSQGGANTFRTVLTLNEQIRLTRRVMIHALRLFGDQAQLVSMAAVPGNHGEPQRFAGKGVTRYDDSHDTESLIAVADAAALNPEAFGHVNFFVPQTDEMTVTLPIAGTVVGHAHGHQWRYGKHFEWWKGQAFEPSNPLGNAQLLLSGHLHHELIESDGKRLFIQVPAMESESTWWRHSKGSTGNPGLIVAITKDGAVSPLEIVR